MRSEISVAGGGADARFLGWAPVPALLQLSDVVSDGGPFKVRLRNRQGVKGGKLRFFETFSGSGVSELSLTLPSGPEPVSFYLAGEYGSPSTEADDAVVEVVDDTGELLGAHPFMVRIRKDAQSLTVAERDRFLNAFATFNGMGAGGFANFRNAHRDNAVEEAHGRAAFLPWHRCFLLDLERELQAIDPRVAIPYWRFDAPAPKLFTQDFIGAADQRGHVHFSSANPLKSWVTDGTRGVDRKPTFDTRTAAAPVLSENDTLALGAGLYTPFLELEKDPHGAAHTSFEGQIDTIDTAARDPLFFLLHANVDRLWARWQRMLNRFDSAQDSTYLPQGHGSNTQGQRRIGHCSLDSMWPWNGDVSPPRPGSAPGGTLASSPMTTAPGLAPTVADMVDYQGIYSPTKRLGFDYDDVEFEF